MNNRFVLTAIIIILILATSDLQAQDINTISDKDLHILAGTIVSLGTAGAIFIASNDYLTITSTAVIAGATAIVAGIGKELFDTLGFGTPEFRDILNTVLGGVVGISAITFSLSAFPPGYPNNSNELRYSFITVSAALSLSVLQYLFTESNRSRGSGRELANEE
ncbi:MAG: hypothetical protein HN368_24240 [Spirochaetales bacterium]|jgi:hypothetical protein|nr:hypothetical protein [Spirochaetales bacterium]